MSALSPSERARQRAEARLQEKASRAASQGIRLPSKKKQRGWETLRSKLKQGTLMPSLRSIVDASKRNSARRASRASVASTASSVPSRIKLSGAKKTTGMIIMEAKAAHENSKRKRLERQERRKLIEKQRKLERELEYLNFPTILGWYFDGFFTPYFQLNEEYATIFNQMELEVSKNKENSIKETFAEFAKRYFWPPNVIGGFCFRTRGIYLDFKEIMKDPPHTPPEIILDKRTEAVTLFVATEKTEIESRVPSEEAVDVMSEQVMGETELAVEEAKVQRLIKEIEDNPELTDEEKAIKKRAVLFAFKKKKERAERSRAQEKVAQEMHFKSLNKHDFYFDDQIPGFFAKKRKDRDKYYFDSNWDVWRIKRKINYFPNDFYWDEQLAMFFPKDRTRPPDYYLYDPNIAAYRVAGESILPNWRNVKPADFFFDYKVGKWLRKSKTPAAGGASPYFDENSQRSCANKTKDTPDDFYFDIFTQQFERKVPGGKYVYDYEFGAWKPTNSPVIPKGSLKPVDFYWNETENVFKKKDAPSSFFSWDQNNNFFRKKRSLHGKYHPKNWTWVDKKKMWQIKKSASRNTLVSDSLYWRPDRDYDKPWLEYVGGYRDHYIEYDYDRLSDEEDAKSGRTMVSQPVSSSSGKNPRKIQFTSSEPNLKPRNENDAASSTKESGKGKKSDALKDEHDILSIGSSKLPGSIMKSDTALTSDGKQRPTLSASETLMFVDTLDRKTLKVSNLGHVVNDTDLRKYFASVKKVIRPLIPGTTLQEEYAYLKFKTDEAAAAALKTMHGQVIKGQTLKLVYKLKNEDETEEKDMGSVL